MNKLLSVLLAAALVTPAFAADAPKAAAPAAAPAAAAPAAAPAAGKSSVAGELVTPQSDKAAMKEIIAKAKVDSDAAKAKSAAGKK